MLRPDEQSANAYIERDQRTRGNIKSAGSAAISLGSAALGTKILPFLNEYIPKDLALKGISKISPKIGDFLKKGLSQGLDLKEGLEFVKNKISPTQDQRNLIEQYSPELHQFIDQHIKSGRSPIEAGALATLDRKGQKSFKDVIKKIEADHKTSFLDLLQTIYGSQQQNPQQPQAQQQQNQQPTAQPYSQQQGTGQAALAAILQRLQQARGM